MTHCGHMPLHATHLQLLRGYTVECDGRGGPSQARARIALAVGFWPIVQGMTEWTAQ